MIARTTSAERRTREHDAALLLILGDAAAHWRHR
jgi:hypothetical protein